MRDRLDWKFLRMRKKITLKEVAKHVGCSISYINKWENGFLYMNPEWEKAYKEFIENYKPN